MRPRAERFYDIVDKDGDVMPIHYSGRRRTFEEATLMVTRLNKDGENAPYKMIRVRVRQWRRK